MGSLTDANIQARQNHLGIQPPSREEANTLRTISDTAFALIKIIERELSGIRDGDGGWHGGDPVGGTMNDLTTAIESYRAICEREWKARKAG